MDGNIVGDVDSHFKVAALTEDNLLIYTWKKTYWHMEKVNGLVIKYKANT